MFLFKGGVHRQGQVGVEFAQEEQAAGLLIHQHGVLAEPADAGLLCQGALHHRGGVDEGAIAELADFLLDLLGQIGQSLAHQLVVITPQRVA